MYLNLTQYVAANPEPAKVQAAIRATWDAREQVEVIREQFFLSKALSQMTTGQYLYNQQGPLNAWMGSKAVMVKDFSAAMDEGNKAAGIKSVKELFPSADSTTRPASSTLSDLEKLRQRLGGK